MEFNITNLEPISQYAYLSSNKRFVTKRGKTWMLDYKRQLKEQMESFNYTILESENIQCEIELTFCNKRKNDIDNSIKQIFDGMEGIVITNDRFITKLIATKTYCKKVEGLCNIKIKISDLNK